MVNVKAPLALKKEAGAGLGLEETRGHGAAKVMGEIKAEHPSEAPGTPQPGQPRHRFS